jgi:hypothetical protein
VEPELKEMLQRRAGEARIEPELPRPVLRRARRRRAVNGALAACTAAAVVALAVVGIQAAMHSPSTHRPASHRSATPSGSIQGFALPRPFPGMWPESTVSEFTRTVRAVEGGAFRWRRDPELTAREFASDVMGWPAAAIRLRAEAVSRTEERLIIWNLVFDKMTGRSTSDPWLSTTLTLDAFGPPGSGVWVVTDVRSGAIDLQTPSTRQDLLIAKEAQPVAGNVLWMPFHGAVEAAEVPAAADSRLQPGPIDPWVPKLAFRRSARPQFKGILPATPTSFKGPVFLVVRLMTHARTSGVVTPGSETVAIVVRSMLVEPSHG